ncbi:urease accessory protein UreD [Croceicoccus bisphenolivorans]|uniref:urease accessory protein UreD n=1 Tax=Croceicoccus bisphenolivorans TaxID=1783232 RepID=UPI00082D3AC3|nr:urease accessory protein UreD [Croceicoccus bisphenolivorans]
MSSAAPAHQRLSGQARLAFGAAGIRDLYQRAPSRFLFPVPASGEFPLAVNLTTSGGLTGGDRIAVEIAVDPNACGSVTTQAAEKLYRVLPEDDDISIKTRISVGDGGRCEWLGQEAILFEGTRVRRMLEADLSGNGALLAAESIVMGRSAMGETFTRGLIHDAWRIRRNGRLVWADGMHMAGDIAAIAAKPFGFGDARAVATLVYAGPDAAGFLDLARTLAPEPDGGASCLDEILVLRWAMADAHAMRDRVIAAAGALRAAVFGLAPRLPVLWTC